MLEAYDVVVMEGAMNLDLGHELLLGATLCEGALLDDFGGLDLLVVQVSELVTLGESALAQELALEVLLDADVSVKLDYLFFDDSLAFFFGCRFAHSIKLQTNLNPSAILCPEIGYCPKIGYPIIIKPANNNLDNYGKAVRT